MGIFPITEPSSLRLGLMLKYENEIDIEILKNFGSVMHLNRASGSTLLVFSLEEVMNPKFQ